MSTPWLYLAIISEWLAYSPDVSHSPMGTWKLQSDSLIAQVSLANGRLKTRLGYSTIPKTEMNQLLSDKTKIYKKLSINLEAPSTST